MKYLLMILALSLVGCTSAPLTPEEFAVRILRKSDPGAECKEIGKVHAPGLASMTEEGREADLKRATYNAGADTVTIDRRDENGTIFGTAFNCPTK